MDMEEQIHKRRDYMGSHYARFAVRRESCRASRNLRSRLLYVDQVCTAYPLVAVSGLI